MTSNRPRVLWQCSDLTRSWWVVLAGSVVCASGASALAGPPTAVVSTIAGHPSSLVPGAAPGRFSFLKTPRRSPDGSRWIMRAISDLPSDSNDLLLVGAGSSFALVGQEGDPAVFAPDPLETLGLFDDMCAINNAGQYAFGNNTKNGSTASDEYIVLWTGSAFETIAREDDPVPAVPGFTYGCCLRGTNITNDGRVAYMARDLRSGPSIPDVLIFDGTALAIQQDTAVVDPIGGFGDFWASFVIDRLFMDSAGTNWIALGDGISSRQLVAINNTVVLAELSAIPGASNTSPVNTMLDVWMDSDGSWYARGDLADGTDFLVRNGTDTLLVGDPITPGAGEHWAASGLTPFKLHVNNNHGDTIVAGVTDGPTATNAVVVLNDDTVVLRKGDAVDLDGDGTADDAFVASFEQDEGFLTDGLDLYLNAKLTNAAGDAIGEAMLIVALAPACAADLTGSADPNSPAFGVPDGILDANDFFFYLGLFGSGDLAADLTGSIDPNDPGFGVPDGALDASDFFFYLDLFALGCP